MHLNLNNVEITLALLKPHVLKNVCALRDITQKVENEFQIIRKKEIVITPDIARRFYEEHIGKFFYNRLSSFMCSGPSLAMILASENCIKKWRNLMGPTKIFHAIYSQPDCLRALYGLTDTRNACHGSDSPDSALREIKIVFPEMANENEFKEISEKLENEKIRWIGASVHKRPPELAKDETPSIDAVKEFLIANTNIDKVALFQCTSIFLKNEYIFEAYHLFKSADCVFSATRSFKLRWTVSNNNLYTVPLNFDPQNRPRRQDWNGEYVENGMFYFTRRQLILNNLFQNDKCLIVAIPEEDALEIDTFKDLQIARCLQS